jgi:hypothetical protein
MELMIEAYLSSLTQQRASSGWIQDSGWLRSTASKSRVSHIWSDPDQQSVTLLLTNPIGLVTGQRALLLSGLLTHTRTVMTLLAFQRRWLRRTVVSCLGISASVSALLPPMAMARPWWTGNTSNGYQTYGAPPLTPEQQAQRCNTGRLIGGLGGGAVGYTMSRDDGRAWAIPLGALLGSQVGCNAAAGRGPLPW